MLFWLFCRITAPFSYYIHHTYPELPHPFGIISTPFALLLHPFASIFTVLTVLTHLFGIIFTLFAVLPHPFAIICTLAPYYFTLSATFTW